VVLHVEWTRAGRLYFGYWPSHPRLYAIDARTHTVTPLAVGRYDDDHLAFAPDGDALAFTTTRFSSEPALALMNWDTRAITPLHVSDGGVRELAWSPDGGQLAFVLNRGGYSDTRQLRAIARDGSGARQFTTHGDVRAPTWSPDGAWITYRALGNVRRVRADGGGVDSTGVVIAAASVPATGDSALIADAGLLGVGAATRSPDGGTLVVGWRAHSRPRRQPARARAPQPRISDRLAP
jgi:dipeptidyl aminopeptidase/acylaminoacyl peptidase